MLVGGAAAPRSMIAGFKERHGLIVVHGWGMTETSPVATTAQLIGDLAEADAETQFDSIAMQGIPLPLVELRHRDAEGHLLPWDGESMGELDFSDLEFRFLGANAALVLGKWHLKRETAGDIGGVFTLVWQKFPEGWKIIHDHTSTVSQINP